MKAGKGFAVCRSSTTEKSCRKSGKIRIASPTRLLTTASCASAVFPLPLFQLNLSLDDVRVSNFPSSLLFSSDVQELLRLAQAQLRVYAFPLRCHHPEKFCTTVAISPRAAMSALARAAVSAAIALWYSARFPGQKMSP